MSQEPYSVSDFYKVLDGYTIYKSQRTWNAILVTEDQQSRKDLRLYQWKAKTKIGEDGKSKVVWKISLGRNTVRFWNFDLIAQKVKELKQKWGIS
jgi:hypothetical protein